MSENKSQAEVLKEQLYLDYKHLAKKMEDDEIKLADQFCEGYKKFLDNAKTEREAVRTVVKMATEKGFIPGLHYL